jgi:hypothetical protein
MGYFFFGDLPKDGIRGLGRYLNNVCIYSPI